MRGGGGVAAVFEVVDHVAAVAHGAAEAPVDHARRFLDRVGRRLVRNVVARIVHHPAARHQRVIVSDDVAERRPRQGHRIGEHDGAVGGRGMGHAQVGVLGHGIQVEELEARTLLQEQADAGVAEGQTRQPLVVDALQLPLRGGGEVGNVLAAHYQGAADVAAANQLVHHQDCREYPGAGVAEVKRRCPVQPEVPAQHGGGGGLDVVFDLPILLGDVGRDDEIDGRWVMARLRQASAYRRLGQVHRVFTAARHAPAGNAGQALQRHQQPLPAPLDHRPGRYFPFREIDAEALDAGVGRHAPALAVHRCSSSPRRP